MLPPDKTYIKGSNIDRLADEIEKLINEK